MLLAVLAGAAPAAVTEARWADGAVALRVAAHRCTRGLSDDLVTSVRCPVQVGSQVVVSTNRDGISHPWPGGRRRAGETFAATAAREVHEETGWLLEDRSPRQLGWLRFEHLTPPPRDHAFPYPDFCQVVLAGRAHDRDGGPAADWTDTEGYEVTSRLMSIDDALAAVSGDPVSRVFLALLAV